MAKQSSGKKQTTVDGTLKARIYPAELPTQVEIALARAYGDGMISLDEAAFPWALSWDVALGHDVTLGLEEDIETTPAADLGQAA